MNTITSPKCTRSMPTALTTGTSTGIRISIAGNGSMKHADHEQEHVDQHQDDERVRRDRRDPARDLARQAR